MLVIVSGKHMLVIVSGKHVRAVDKYIRQATRNDVKAKNVLPA